MNPIAKHFLGGVTAVAGLVFLIIGLVTGSGLLTTLGALGIIGGVGFVAYNMYQIFNRSGAIDVLNEVSLGFKKAKNPRNPKKGGVKSFGDLGDFTDVDD